MNAKQKKVTLKQLQIGNSIQSTDAVGGMTQLNLKNQATGSFNINPASNRATQGNLNQVTTPVGQHNSSMISNLYQMGAANSKATSVGPGGIQMQMGGNVQT